MLSSLVAEGMEDGSSKTSNKFLKAGVPLCHSGVIVCFLGGTGAAAWLAASELLHPQ